MVEELEKGVRSEGRHKGTERGGLAIQLPIEQDQSADTTKRDGEGMVLLC